MIELAILGVLTESELHGYELKKRLREVLGPLSSVSFGSLYPALARLEAMGAVKAVEAAALSTATAIPMTGSFTGEAAAFRAVHSAQGAARAVQSAQGAARALRRKAERGPRGKKVYGITEVGEARLRELVADPSDDDRAFNVKLAFCRFCDPATRLALLRRRRDALARALVERRARAGVGKAADRYLKALTDHDTESVERDIAWLDRLIETEETS